MKSSHPHNSSNAQDEQALFQEWLAVMDDSLEVFITTLPPEVGRRMDYTFESLDALEAWMLERYPSSDALLAESEMLDLEYIARYIGETARRRIGGEWRSSFEDPQDPYYGIPRIMFAEQVPALVPRFLATTSMNRRTGRFLRMVISNTGEMLAEQRGQQG